MGRAATSGRVDDNEETIKKRLRTFHNHNDTILSTFASKAKRINGEPAPNEVFKEVETYLDPLFG